MCICQKLCGFQKKWVLESKKRKSQRKLFPLVTFLLGYNSPKDLWFHKAATLTIWSIKEEFQFPCSWAQKLRENSFCLTRMSAFVVVVGGRGAGGGGAFKVYLKSCKLMLWKATGIFLLGSGKKKMMNSLIHKGLWRHEGHLKHCHDLLTCFWPGDNFYRVTSELKNSKEFHTPSK